MEDRKTQIRQRIRAKIEAERASYMPLRERAEKILREETEDLCLLACRELDAADDARRFAAKQSREACEMRLAGMSEILIGLNIFGKEEIDAMRRKYEADAAGAV